jgi:hypothetical protein
MSVTDRATTSVAFPKLSAAHPVAALSWANSATDQRTKSATFAANDAIVAKLGATQAPIEIHTWYNRRILVVFSASIAKVAFTKAARDRV